MASRFCRKSSGSRLDKDLRAGDTSPTSVPAISFEVPLIELREVDDEFLFDRLV